MTHWQEPPQSTLLSCKQPPSAYAQLPHIEVFVSLLLHEWPPQHIWPPLPAPSPPMQYIMPVPDPAVPSTPSPSPHTHQDPDSCPVEVDQGSETSLWLHVGDCGA